MSSSQPPEIEIEIELSTAIESDAVCRICHEGHNKAEPLFHPCLCKGSIRYIHEKCLNTWLKHNKSAKCEVCKHSFIYQPIFVKGETVPSSINYQSFIDIASWIYDELVTKNSDICNRLLIILFLWFIITPFIILQINHIFYKYFILYDLIHFNSIYSPLILQCFNKINISSSTLQSVLSYFCPFQVLSAKYIKSASFYYLAWNGGKGIMFMLQILTVCGIALCMKNNGKIVRPRQPNHIIPAQAQTEQKEEEFLSENENEHKSEHKPKRKNAMFELENEYKSPSLCDVSDENENEVEYESDAASSASSTLSELELKLAQIQTRITQKKKQNEEKEEEKRQELQPENEGNINNDNNEQETDELDVLLNTIGLNDNYNTLVIKHIYWMLWLINNHFSHFILPHFAGQITLHSIYFLCYIFLPNHKITTNCMDLIDFNQYNNGTFIFTHFARNLCVMCVGYCSCFLYQCVMLKIMLKLVKDLQHFLRLSMRQNTSIFIFNLYLWLFDKMDIFKGILFLCLKFICFPLILTLSMECCFFPIREASKVNNYRILYETFIFHKESINGNGMDTKTTSAIMYIVLMLLWTSIVICTYLSTVDILEKIMRPTAFTFLFRSVIETKNWLHPFSYKERSSAQLRKWCMTTLHFVVAIFAFLGLPSYIMSQCNHIIPLNVPSVGKIKSFHVKSLLLQDYVLLFSIVPMLFFWEPILRALVIQTLHLSAYVLHLKFYLLRNYKSREDRRELLDQNLWHEQQPFMADMEDNNVELPPPDPAANNNIDINALEEKDNEDISQLIDDIVSDLIDNSIQYSLNSISREITNNELCESEAVKSINSCIEFMTNCNLESDNCDDYKHALQYDNDEMDVKEDPDAIYEIEAIIDHVSNDDPQCGDVFDLYRVKWEAFSLTQATWEPVEHLYDAMALIDKYNTERQTLQGVLLDNYWNDQFLLNVIWHELSKCKHQQQSEQAECAHCSAMWVSDGRAFQIVNVEQFIKLIERFLDHRNSAHALELFTDKMSVLGFEQDEELMLFHHPCFFRAASGKMLECIGKNTVLLAEHTENIEQAMSDHEDEDESEEDGHRYYAAFLDQDNIIEIPEQQERNGNNNGDDMDMMGFFDGIDLGGTDNIIPAPIVMNVQLDNFGRLIKINVELDTYNEANEIYKNNKDKKKKLAGDNMGNEEMKWNINDNEYVNDVLMEEKERREEKEEKKEQKEERVKVGDLMRSLNSYQRSELLRDILSICHPLYITESKYILIYDHNTKSDLTHPLLRVLKKPSELISVNDIVTICDKLLLYLKVCLTVIIVVVILNAFHLLLFLQCLVYGRKLWKILSLIPKVFIFQLGFTNFTRFDQYGIMSFAFNQHTIHDLHCIALSLWWFPAMYYMLNVIYTLCKSLLHKCSNIIDKCVDFVFYCDNSMADISVTNIFKHIFNIYIKYMIIFCIHHMILPLLFGFSFQFALWSPVFIGHNQSFCLSVLEAWIEGFFVWNIFLPMMPLSMVGNKQFKQTFKLYMDTKFVDMNLCSNLKDVYWPFLRLIIIHLFVPIAVIQSQLFAYVWNNYSDVLRANNYNNPDELLIFEYNKKFYLRYIMRKLLQLRLFIAYKRAIKNGCNKVWDQFINDRYVVGKKLVNYYYKKKNKETTIT